MNFCFVCDDNYGKKLVVLLKSIFINNKGNHNIFILSKNISDQTIEKVHTLANENNSKLFYIVVDDSPLSDVPILRNDFNKSPYYKLLIPLLIPENIDRLLYMDIDMIVNMNMSELYNVDLKNNYFAAVPDPIWNERDLAYLDRLGIDTSKGEAYFNSGLILFNLKLFREKYDFNAVQQYISKNGKNFKFHDQEVLNGMFNKNYLILDEKYNYLTTFRGIGDAAKYYLGLENKLINKIVVYHFANQTKPWNNNFIGKFENVYWKYAKLTSYYSEIEKNEKNSFIKQFKFLISVLKRRLKK